MSLQTFRYAACGGGNTLLALAIYYVSFKYILHEENLNIGFYEFKSHVAALLMTTVINFPLGFFFMKYVVFSDSSVKGKIQLVRYLAVYLFNLLLNYLLLKVFVENLNLYPVLAQIITTVVVIFVSYIAQRNFTFRIGGGEDDPIT